MTHRVLFTESFRDDIANHVRYLREQHVADDIVERWYDRLFARLDDLGTFPRLCPVDERESAEQGREVRKLVFARYIITYHVDDERHLVLLLAMVHGARRR